MKRYFSNKTLRDIQANFRAVGGKAERLVYRYVSHRFTSQRAGEYAKQGFARRVGTLRRCIENVFRTVPAGTVKIPPRNKLLDVQINVQAFVANVYGAIDNLAWVWVYEQRLDVKMERKQVGLRKGNRQLRASLGDRLREYLEGIDPWLEYVVEYRDSFAHRIPLYIPPGGIPPKRLARYNELMIQINHSLSAFDAAEYSRLMEEADKLLVFQPLMTHSFNEATAHYAFHVQMIADFLTIEQLGVKMLADLQSRTQSP